MTLPTALARAPWFARGSLDATSLRVLDELAVGPTTLRWAVVDGDQRPAVLVLSDDDVSLLSATLALTTRESWATATGGVVRWHGAVQAGLRLGELVHTTATNAVAKVAGGLVVKVYRVVGDDRGEAAFLSTMDGCDLLPEVVGHLEYLPPGGQASCLALITRVVPGVSLDLPLRAALHATWARVPTCPADLLRAVRPALVELHLRLNAGRPPKTTPLAERLPGVTALLGLVGRTLPANARSRHALLDRCAALARELVVGANYPAGPRHGDLHLANVLIDSTQRVRFVDPDGAAVPGSSPLDDVAALWRAVECFAADEELARISREQGYDKHDYARRLRRAALEADRPDRQPAPGSRWAAEVVRDLISDVGPAALAVPYLLRALHELRYHGERAGDPAAEYYADLSWLSLADFVVGQEGMVWG